MPPILQREQKKFEYTKWHTTVWLFQLQTEIKMFDAKRKCRQRMEWVKREEGKKIVRAPKEQCHYFKCICVFFKSKTVHLPLHIYPLVRKTLHSRRWQKRERWKKVYDKKCTFFFCLKLAKDMHVVVLALCFILFLFGNYLIQFVSIFLLFFSPFILRVVCSFLWVVANCWKAKQEKKNTTEWMKKNRVRWADCVYNSEIYATLK